MGAGRAEFVGSEEKGIRGVWEYLWTFLERLQITFLGRSDEK